MDIQKRIKELEYDIIVFGEEEDIRELEELKKNKVEKEIEKIEKENLEKVLYDTTREQLDLIDKK